ncbi:MAG: hypothetical protein R2698_06885 [Microthrixaceae bacterium]
MSSAREAFVAAGRFVGPGEADGGMSLREFVARRGALGDPAAVALAAAVRDAMVDGAVESINPSSVMLSGSGLDGASAVADGAGAFADVGFVGPTGDGGPGSAVGALADDTVLFSAPEVLRGARGDDRSAVYSLGLTLWFAMVGRYPYLRAGESDAVTLGLDTVIARICSGEVVEPRELGVSAPLSRVFAKAIALDPAARYGSVDELVGQLLDALPASVGRARTRTSETGLRGPRWALTSRVLHSVVWILVWAVLVVGIVLLWRDNTRVEHTGGAVPGTSVPRR